MQYIDYRYGELGTEVFSLRKWEVYTWWHSNIFKLFKAG